MTIENSQTSGQLQRSTAKSVWTPFEGLEGVRGGISLKADGSMSWSGDTPEAVAKNRAIFIENIGLDWRNGVGADQVHSLNIHRAQPTDSGQGMTDRESRFRDTDAFVTNVPGLVLTTLHADCAPIYFVDPDQRAIGMAHAGWRGILGGLAGQMIRRMHAEFHSDPYRLRVAVGPMVSTEVYTVDEELAAQFSSTFGPQVVVRLNDRPHLDLFQAISTDLLRAGLDPVALPERPPCTAQNGHYASYRRDGAPVRSMMAWLVLT